MGRADIKAVDAAYGDSTGSQEFENIRGCRSDGMHDEIAWCDTGNRGEGGIPAQGIEMKARMFVDHTGEPPFGHAGSELCVR